nr:reverse transcriptase domain-containing protein [Tanacetum cinerariifolium]
MEDVDEERELEAPLSSDHSLPEGWKGKLQKKNRYRIIENDTFHNALCGPVLVRRIPKKLKIRNETFVTKHKLNKDKKITPMQQKKKRMTPEQSVIASKEVEELRKARILRETRDINKACLKDCYSLPKIDWKVDSLFDFKLKYFLDAYKGYHQIQMEKEEEHKTTFHAQKGVYCYRKMPFVLKNTGATYQRLVDKVFESQIGRNMEAYMEDIVIKGIDEEEMLADIKEPSERLQKINMKLNQKCSFEMEEEQFLGHVVSKKGIKANPSKIQVLTSLQRPKTIKEVQSLNGKLALLKRFLSKCVEKSLPFFKTLKGCLEKKDFTWIREADKAFKEIKRYIEKLPTLIAPKARESLIVYLAASENARIARWAIELREHEIEFKPKNAIKAKVLADFLEETQEEDEETNFKTKKKKEKT